MANNVGLDLAVLVAGHRQPHQHAANEFVELEVERQRHELVGRQQPVGYRCRRRYGEGADLLHGTGLSRTGRELPLARKYR